MKLYLGSQNVIAHPYIKQSMPSRSFENSRAEVINKIMKITQR